MLVIAGHLIVDPAEGEVAVAVGAAATISTVGEP